MMHTAVKYLRCKANCYFKKKMLLKIHFYKELGEEYCLIKLELESQHLKLWEPKESSNPLHASTSQHAWQVTLSFCLNPDGDREAGRAHQAAYFRAEDLWLTGVASQKWSDCLWPWTSHPISLGLRVFCFKNRTALLLKESELKEKNVI